MAILGSRAPSQLGSPTDRGIQRRTNPFATIDKELTLHEMVEVEARYPALKVHPRAKDIVPTAHEEHLVVDVLLGETDALDVRDETLVTHMDVEHHAEEEEGEMFPRPAGCSIPGNSTTSPSGWRPGKDPR